MRAHRVLNLTVVLPSGEVIKTHGRTRARKTAMGWDVSRLFLGSEGTLGVSERKQIAQRDHRADMDGKKRSSQKQPSS